MDVVIGTGPLGQAVARELTARGRLVRAVNSTGTGAFPGAVPVRAADICDHDEVAAALAGADVVYLSVDPAACRRARTVMTIVGSVIEAAAQSGATVAYCDTLAAYGPATDPYHEGMQPTAPGRWGRARADASETLLAAHAAGRIGAVVLRTSDLYGPGVRDSPYGQRIFGRLLDGKPALVLGDPDATHAVTYVEDAARALVTLAQEPATHGEVWHAPTPTAVSAREFVELVAGAAGVQPKLRRVPGWVALLAAPFSKRYRRLRELWYCYDEPHLVDDRKYVSTFGDVATPLEDGIERTVEWFRDGGRPAVVQPPPAAE
ncbi:NAD-dependent epimerase/dehydratase family protein [Haloarchaeobius amylolyticus]|uniref:NAD-dependent epimerase/dehydratase family protein n=1 Tax=Haloarchaeobius amylolyticus TaxID=1198296 RepID=UPI00226F944D|nr:NAD-dependent epimerase/dehydratase family protein [Haloarchaeobius amylolyticus]